MGRGVSDSLLPPLPCSLVEVGTLCIKMVVAVVMISVAKWLMNLVLKSSRITPIGLAGTTVAAFLAGLGIVLATETLQSWFGCVQRMFAIILD